MLFHDEFIKKSLSNFLHLDCLLDIDLENIKEKFGSFSIKGTKKNGEKIFSYIPKDIFIEFTDGEEKYLKITKADLLRYQKEQMANPIRVWGNDDEYNTRLITSLLFGATPGWHEYCTNLYEHGQDRYIHDQRAGAGRAKQFLNWMYDDEGYPGRLEEQNEYEKRIPFCFPNPELLRSHFSYAGNNQYALVVLDSWENTVLYQKLNELKLLHQFTIQEPDDKEKIKRAIIAPFCSWQEAITKILEEQSLEKDLSLEQQKTHVISLIREFVENQAAKNKEEIQGTKQLEEKVKGFIQSIKENGTGNPNVTQVQRAIKALYQVRKNIAANKEFFDKFTDDKGVLQSEQYFRALTAHIDSEITFLVTFQNVLTEKDLDIFLNQTCTKVHSDINELLLAHDFLLTDDLEHRDIVINFTRKEVKELYQYVSDIINTYRFLLDNRNALEIEDANDAKYKIIQDYIDSTKKSIPTLDIDHLVSVIKEEKDSENFKNKWLLHQLKLHPLSEHFKIENINDTQDKVGELWKIVEDNNSNKKFNKSNFINGLTEVLNSSANNKNTVYIEQSRWLAFKHWLYNVSYYVPLSSIWLSHVNPGKSRTGTKYKGKTLKEKLYTKNRVIQTSEFSQNIREALSLDTGNKEFVESKHEASWLIKEYRKKHRISGAKEKVLTYLGKNKILWYTLLTIFILFTSAAAIAGRVLSCLGIMPPVVVDRMINSLRGIFDGFVVMFGLDTIIDSIFILAVDLAGLVVRCVDYLLLFGLVSKTIRYLTKGIGKVVQGISGGFKALYETIRIYGLKGSFILLHDKITNSKQPAAAEKYKIKEQKEEGCEVKEKIEKKKDTTTDQEHDIDNILSSIKKLWQESQTENLKSNGERIKYVFNNLKSQIEIDLFDRDVKFPKLSKNLPTLIQGSIEFQYRFHYLLKKYPEKFSIGPSTGSNGQNEENDVTVENYRMKTYDSMVETSLKTKLSPKKQEEMEFNNASIIKECISNQAKEFIGTETLDKKIAAIEWARKTLKNSDIDFAIKKAEPVFRTTKAHISAEVALHDYSEKLKEFRNRITRGEKISVDELNAYEAIFTRYIVDAHYMLGSIDQFTAKNHESSSLHQFRAAFSDNCALFTSPSHGAKNAALIFGIDRGGVSLASRVKEYTVDFVEEFQDPKVFAVAFAAYYIAVQIPGLLEVAHTITDVPEIMLDHVGLGMVYDHFLETDVGRTLIEMVYQRGELLKDVWVLFNEFKDGVIGESELKKRWSEIKQEVKKTKSHCDHHEHGNAKERLISFINGLVHLIFTIFFINLIRNLFHKTKTEYRTFFHYYEKEQCVIGNPKLDETKGNQNIIDNDMYNFPKVSKCLSNTAFVQNAFNKLQSVSA
ncbi:MAG: hypothetical protein sL5_01990 [Candidatus Mesenet longicola]|uniref:Uncharacterized protein n=1 Tax=Candidatus Mesenet longicola TaxID=1892558 RepID=A0A8J3HX53_9RICK|nr:MAG: hypothetical protein sGL2_01980 [Candidatus Mesenet longicola]GHM59206.1 MAG: hypothetical protein sL5_01990 [Candidatus Mesenet longicola]